MPKKNALKGQTFRTIMQITASEDGKLPTDIMILPKGDWNTQFYGPMQVTEDHLTQIVANFKSGVRKLVPIDVDHDGGRAAGWIQEVRAEEDGLHAKADWTPYGEELLGSKEYRLFSPEWSFDYVDPEHGTRHGAVLIAGSLTNRPLFKELPVLMASEGSSAEKGLTNEKAIMILLGSDQSQRANDNMNIKDILAKKPADRTEEEVKFLADHASEMDEAQSKQLETEKTEAEEAEAQAQKEKEEADAKAKADADAAAEKEKADKEAADKAEADRKANEGKTVTISANELSELRQAKEANDKAQAELRRVATEKEVNALVANDKGGKILPKQAQEVTDMLMTFSEAQKSSFIAFVQGLPEIKIAGEKGQEDATHLTAHQQVSKLVDEAMKADDKLDKSSAIKKVLSENEALAKQYNEELE